MLFHDAALADLAAVADNVDARAYAGGWVQLANFDNPEQGVYPFAKNTFTTAADIVPPQRAVFSANSFHVGSQIHAHAWGTVSSAAGTATITPSFYWNGAASGTVLCAGAAQTPAITTVSTWHCDFWGTFTAVGGTPTGATSTLWCSAVLIGIGATPSTPVLMPSSALASFTVATNAASWLTMAATWSASAAGNTTSVYGFDVFVNN